MNDKEREELGLLKTIQGACAMGLQLMPPTLLCQSIGAVGLKQPLTVQLDASLQECLDLLQRHRIGSVVIVDESCKVRGIFTERDCVLKVMGKVPDLSQACVKDFMTPDPVREGPSATLAFALNLMSNGGFRHIPIVDQDDMPIGIVSVKDIVDYLVQRMMGELLESCELQLAIDIDLPQGEE
jgi:CBS domain-containing protein